MTAIESSYVDTQTFLATTMTADVLKKIEPSITFKNVATAATATAITSGVVDKASANTVDYDGTAPTSTSPGTYCVACVSASGNTFGLYVDKAAGITYVKILGATVSTGW